MTGIDFYHGAQDKAHEACRLIGELRARGRRVLVYVRDAALAAQVDHLLWTQPPTGFLPHCSIDSKLAAQTPIVFGSSLERAPHHETLVNLDGDLPPEFSRFEQLVEIVGTEESDRAPARARFKFYRDRGYELRSHDVATRRS